MNTANSHCTLKHNAAHCCAFVTFTLALGACPMGVEPYVYVAKLTVPVQNMDESVGAAVDEDTGARAAVDEDTGATVASDDVVVDG
jgi:hypothetical protein